MAPGLAHGVRRCALRQRMRLTGDPLRARACSYRALMLHPGRHGARSSTIAGGAEALPQGRAGSTSPDALGIDGGAYRLPARRAKAGSASASRRRWAAPEAGFALTTTLFPPVRSSPTRLEMAKAGCLSPNNARMLAEAKAKGSTTRLVRDAALGNVAETANGQVITRCGPGWWSPDPKRQPPQRHHPPAPHRNLRATGWERESRTVMGFDDFAPPTSCSCRQPSTRSRR